MKHLVPAVMLFVAPPAMSQAYGRATISNYALKRATVVVTYASCRSDTFLVSQGRVAGDSIVPGVNQAQTRRGACLIKSITGTFEGDTAKIMPFAKHPLAVGSEKSHFVLRKDTLNPSTTPWAIWSQSDWDSQQAQYKSISDWSKKKH